MIRWVPNKKRYMHEYRNVEVDASNRVLDPHGIECCPIWNLRENDSIVSECSLTMPIVILLRRMSWKAPISLSVGWEVFIWCGICIQNWGHDGTVTMSWLNMCIEIGVVPAALLAENYKNNSSTEYRMEGLLYAYRNMRGVEKGWCDFRALTT